jgi:hypothetical protein
MKAKFTFVLIPDNGQDADFSQRAFKSAVTAEAAARTECRVIFAKCPSVNVIEMVVLEGSTTVPGTSDLIVRAS